MRPLLLTLLAAAVTAAALPARNGSDDRRAARRSIEQETRDRLKQYLAAFHRMSPAAR